MTFDRTQAEAYLDALWGGREGHVALAFGHGGHVNDGGRYTHKTWDEATFAWPAERELMLGEVARLLAAERNADVYVCPLLRTEPKRRKGNAAHCDVVWVDADELGDLSRLDGLGAFVVGSGSNGHGHVYLRLTEDVHLEERAILARELAARVVKADPKWADNDVLRLPGTVTGKTDPPAPVRFLMSPDKAWRLTPSDARTRLGAALAVPSRLDSTALPDPVRQALTTSTGDRSADHQRLVRVCYTAGLTSDQTCTVVRSYPPSMEKYGRRIDDETIRSYLKCVNDEQRVRFWIPPASANPQPVEQPQANDKPATLGSVLPRSALAALPTVDHLVRGVISQPAAGVLVGAYGLGKTVLAHSLACSVATGRDWLGRPVQQRRVLVVVGEGAYGLHDRLAAWEATWNGGQPVPDDALTFIIKPGSLRDPLARHSIGAYALGGAFGFVILDTFSSLAPDADETKDAPLIMRFLSDLSTAISGTALLVHHPGWSDNGRARGGYQFEANADEVLVLTGAAEGSDLLCLTRKKVKDGPSGRTLWLHRKPAHGSVVIEHARSDEVDVPMRERILSVLTNYGDIGVTGPQLAAELSIDDKGKSTFYKAMRKLTDEGAAVRTGSRGVQRYFLAEYVQRGHNASGTVIPFDLSRSTRRVAESTASGTEVHSEPAGQPANGNREWNATGKSVHKGESSGSAPPSIGGALNTRDSVQFSDQLCAICNKPLQDLYVKSGRTTHPGCRAKTGGDR